MPAFYWWTLESLSFSSSFNSSTNCSDGVQWIWVIMHDCVYSARGQASTILGLLSMLVWMIVGIPQMVKNCRNINGMAGVSLFLILQWMLGDVTNLVGSILTHQLQVQIYVAVYYVSADVILFAQYLWFVRHRRHQCKILAQAVSPSQAVLCISGLFLMSGLGYQIKAQMPRWVSQHFLPDVPDISLVHHAAGRNILATNVQMRIFYGTVDTVGYTVGVVSSILYIGSRLAQIYKNYKHKSTEGLAKTMFWLAVLGNLLYGLSIIVRSVDGVFLIRHLPWIVGSLGVIFLDITLLLQFHYYEQRNFDSLSRVPLLHQHCINVDPVSVTS